MLKKITTSLEEYNGGKLIEKPTPKFQLEVSLIITDAASPEEAWEELYNAVYKAAGYTAPENGEELEAEEEEQEEEQEEEAEKPKISDEIPEGWMDTQEVADLFDVTPPMLSIMVKEGKLPKAESKHGKKNIWKRETIEEARKNRFMPKAADPEEEEESSEDVVVPIKTPIVLIDMDEVVKRTGMDEDTIDLLIDNDRFPDTAPDGEGKWNEADITDYLEKKKKRR